MVSQNLLAPWEENHRYLSPLMTASKLSHMKIGVLKSTAACCHGGLELHKISQYILFVDAQHILFAPLLRVEKNGN